jgi:hypothetical protein
VYRRDLGRGLSRYGFGLIPLWVATKSDILFMEAANHPEVLKGFPRQAELYAAHLDPGGDHAELVADAINIVPHPDLRRPDNYGALLVPLGHTQLEITGIYGALGRIVPAVPPD